MDIATRYNKMYPIFSKRYHFEIASLDSLDEIMEFIEKYWKSNHVLAKSKDLFNWQHLDKTHQRYNFAIARDLKTNEIHAIQGFILSSHFDKDVSIVIQWGAIWKSRGDIAMPLLGTMLYLYLEKNSNWDIDAGVGLSNKAFPIMKKMGHIMGYCNQWYILHPYKKLFNLVGNFKDEKRCSSLSFLSDKFFENCDDYFMDLSGLFLKCIPAYKSLKYYQKRYLEHPVYKYHATKISDNNKTPLAVFIWRTCEHSESKCIRIVDYFGYNDAMEGCLESFQKMLIEMDAEFIDFINAGIDDIYFEKAGFVDRKTTNIILANYFEPFVLQNVDISYHWYSKSGLSPLIFKGDADQDRPNIIPGVNDIQ